MEFRAAAEPVVVFYQAQTLWRDLTRFIRNVTRILQSDPSPAWHSW